MSGEGTVLRAAYERLYASYGPQHWWPGDTAMEVMVGAILTQNTAWTNVERAIANLARAGVLEADRLLALPEGDLAELIRPAGYFNVKARRLRNFCGFYVDHGGFDGLDELDTASLRSALLSVNGIGPETADDILLYAFGRPVFVIDAYTRRLFGRMGAVDPDAGYEDLRAHFERGLAPGSGGRRGRRGRFPDKGSVPEGSVPKGNITSGSTSPALTRLFNEYHALIVRHAKEVCRPAPHCGGCPLSTLCPGVGRTPITHIAGR